MSTSVLAAGLCYTSAALVYVGDKSTTVAA